MILRKRNSPVSYSTNNYTLYLEAELQLRQIKYVRVSTLITPHQQGQP
jgi:hypothetical protein